jgi:transcriptional regulator with XRE-family HTH domain
LVDEHGVELEIGWRTQLRRLRETVDLTRLELAQRASVSAGTVKAYEDGSRAPSRALLTALLDALKAERNERNAILTDAGFKADAVPPGRQTNAPDFTLEEAIEEIDRYPWPSHINNEVFEVVAANRAAQRLWNVDLSAEFPDHLDRNMLAILSRPRFGDCLLNWEEAVGIAVAMVKGNYGEEASPGGANPYFAAVVEHFLKGDQTYVQRFLKVWMETAPAMRKWRFSYPVTWRNAEFGVLRFHVSVNPANHQDWLTFNDWIPMDAATSAALEHFGSPSRRQR